MSRQQLSDHVYQQALDAAVSWQGPDADKADMLMQIATGLQHKATTVRELEEALELYDTALALNLDQQPELQARLLAKKATALNVLPGDAVANLLQARDLLREAQALIGKEDIDPEMAELHLNLGLVLQQLADFGQSAMNEAINEYQLALNCFNQWQYPNEFAILHNNLATAYLSVPEHADGAHLKEALAIQSYREALKVVTIERQPEEYAMLQNNLANTLQYASSNHLLENNLDALEAYDEALRVRHRGYLPIEFANTLCNKGNCLLNLATLSPMPDELASLLGKHESADVLYQQAREIYLHHELTDRVAMIDEVLQSLGPA